MAGQSANAEGVWKTRMREMGMECGSAILQGKVVVDTGLRRRYGNIGWATVVDADMVVVNQSMTLTVVLVGRMDSSVLRGRVNGVVVHAGSSERVQE